MHVMTPTANLQKESIFTEVENHQLHLRRFYTTNDGPVCFLIHGSIENGKIFYSKSDKGLAPYLAHQGYDVFVADLRGRGKSTPKIAKSHNYDQTDTIIKEIPAFIDKVKSISGDRPMHALAHSWGGVLLLSYLARYDNPEINSMVFFGTKRKIDVFNRDKLWRVNILWDKIGSLLVNYYGFLPAIQYGFGSDNEPKEFYRQVKKWALNKPWVDPMDQFNYAKVLKSKTLPPTLYLTGASDTHLGHPNDVQRLMREIGNKSSDQFKLLSKKTGAVQDYDHINILTHPLAPNDHFPEVVNWMRKHQ